MFFHCSFNILEPDFLFLVQRDIESHSGGYERNKKMVPEVMTERNERKSTLGILEVAVSLTGIFKCLLNLNTFFKFTGKADDYKPSTFFQFCASLLSNTKQCALRVNSG